MITKEQIEFSSKLKRRDKDAFHSLYRDFFQNLYKYAWHFVYDYDTAKDMVQGAFLSLWENVDKIDETKNVKAYLFGIVKNACLEHLRSLKIKDAHADKIIESIFFAQIEEHEWDEEMKERLHNSMQCLPEKGQLILIAHFVERKKISEIAQELNIAESTVNTHLKRAMKFLRKNLMHIIFGIGVLELLIKKL